MASRQTVLVLGDKQHSQYHPFSNLDIHIKTLLKNDLEVVCTEAYSELQTGNIERYGLVILYTDRWQYELPEEQAAGLISYTKSGGRLMIIHNGISIQARQDLKEMMGAKFVGHPPFCQLEVQVAAPQHKLMRDLGDFTIADEPYRFEFIPGFETTLLLSYQYEGDQFPAAWTHSYGSGQIVYLMPGHDESVFLNEDYRKVLYQVCITLISDRMVG